MEFGGHTHRSFGGHTHLCPGSSASGHKYIIGYLLEMKINIMTVLLDNAKCFLSV